MAVTIPKRTALDLGIKAGDKITVDTDIKRRTVSIRPLFHINKELIDWTESFIKKYRPALEALAKK